MKVSPRLVAVVLVSLSLTLTAVAAQAADCDARQVAGYRVLALESGRKVAVWYPAAGIEKPFAYSRSNNGFMGSVARDAPPAACPRVPLVVFSHGLGGCALQSLFFTEELARHGYVVAAPDHADAATCGIDREDLRLGNLRTDQSLLDPQRWNEQSEIGRLSDLRAVMRLVADDPRLGPVTDTQRVGAVGHSLGGYAVLGMAGGWPSWKTPEVKAVLAFSPYTAPYVARKALAGLDVPVMYQGGQFDWGITPVLEGTNGAYAATSPPKYFVKLKGGMHIEWTNLICIGQPDVVNCLKAKPNAYLIDRYSIEFLDRHLKGKPSPLLAGDGRGLERFQVEVR